MPFIICRQEGGASMMACAYGELTGRPGICMVTRGPGATNASAGVHVAQQDSIPVILFIGQVARGFLGREAFQEIDFVQMYAPVAKWAAQIEDPARIPEYISRAFHVAVSGRPGPVVLALPEDMLEEEAEAEDALPYRRVEPHPGPRDMMEFRRLLSSAKRPLMVLGGGGWDSESVQAVEAFALASSLPVTVTFRRQDYFNNDHPSYVGDAGITVNPVLGKAIKEADVLILLGTRLSEASSQSYTLLDIPNPKQTLIHIHPDPDELGRVYRPHLPIVASPRAFATALKSLEPADGSGWRARTAAAREAYEAWRKPVASPGQVQLAEVMAWLRGAVPDDTIIANGAGNYAIWIHRFFQFRQFATQLAPASGSMGYGVPAAIAAKLAHPDRTVVAFSGDGCFLMTGQEFATAVQYGVAAIFIVVNNGMYGTIRMHQERHYPERVYATPLVNPDFAAYARAFGGYGAVVERTADFPAAFEAAKASGMPAIIELRVDPEAITPRETLTSIRDTALKRL
jgi:acetolactate synthase-1/2/3 large subunit